MHENRLKGSSSHSSSYQFLSVESVYEEDGTILNSNLPYCMAEKLMFRAKLLADPSLANLIDCEIHILSSKLDILLRQKRFEKVLTESMDFLQFMHILMAEDFSKSLTTKDIAMWLYSIVIHVYTLVSQRLEKESMEEETKRKLLNRLVNLMHFGRRQLDAIGKEIGLFDGLITNRYQVRNIG